MSWKKKLFLTLGNQQLCRQKSPTSDNEVNVLGLFRHPEVNIVSGMTRCYDDLDPHIMQPLGLFGHIFNFIVKCQIFRGSRAENVMVADQVAC